VVEWNTAVEQLIFHRRRAGWRGRLDALRYALFGTELPLEPFECTVSFDYAGQKPHVEVKER
jgi:hypothetical protein